MSMNDLARWFTQRDAGNYPVRDKNSVQVQVDGPDAFREVATAIRTATGPGHYIYLAGWWTQIDFPLIATDATSTLRQMLTQAAQNQVQIRALLWSGHGPMAADNKTASTFINGLADGGAILDARHLNAGSHHQKLVVVNGSQGLIGNLGGLDLDDNRLNTGPLIKGYPPGSPMHDIGCSVIGPAAFDLLQTFIERWQEHPEAQQIDQQKGQLSGLTTAAPDGTGNLFVQIGHTYGNGEIHVGIPGSTTYGGYAFAPKGRRTARDQVLHAIDSAQQFIYMEDQYLVSEEVRDHLKAVLPRLSHLTLLFTADDYVSGIFEIGPGLPCHRRMFLEPLLNGPHGNKVRPFVLDRTLGTHTYVHSKVWIIDDELLLIGSVNCNRRSLTHDSEVMASIWDPTGALPRAVRTQLWSEHLNVPTAQLADPITSIQYWDQPPQGARVARYAVSTSTTRDQAAWDLARDPDGDGAWERSLPDSGYAVVSLAATHGALYSGSNGHVYQIDPADGRVVRHNSLPGVGNHEIRLAVCADKLATGIYGRVVGLQLNNLQNAWDCSLPGAGYDVVSLLASNGSLYAGSKGHVYRLNPTNGTVLQHNALPGRGRHEVRLAAGGQRVFGGLYGYVVCVDANDLHTVWECSLPDAGFGVVSVLATDNALYAGSNGHVYRLDPSNGNVLLHNPLPGRGNHEIRLAVGAGKLAVGIWGYVVGLDPNNLQSAWESSLPSAGFDVVSVLASDVAIYAGSNGYVYRLDPSNGFVQRHSPLIGRGKHEIRLADNGDGQLFVGTSGFVLGLEGF